MKDNINIIFEHDVMDIANNINNDLRFYFNQPRSDILPPIKAIKKVKENKLNPSQSWLDWKEFKLNDGWTLGKYNLKKKTHPNLVEKYEDLPLEEQVKDYVFYAVVKSLYELKKRFDIHGSNYKKNT